MTAMQGQRLSHTLPVSWLQVLQRKSRQGWGGGVRSPCVGSLHTAGPRFATFIPQRRTPPCPRWPNAEGLLPYTCTSGGIWAPLQPLPTFYKSRKCPRWTDIRVCVHSHTQHACTYTQHTCTYMHAQTQHVRTCTCTYIPHNTRKCTCMCADTHV